MKKCKSCQTDIDDKAKKCPNCKSDQRNWFLRHKIMTVILALIAISIIANIGSGKQSASSGTGKATPAPTPMVVDAKAFGDEFDANQVAATAKYKDKLVQLTATISNITDSGLSFQNVTSKEFSATQISCNISDKNQLMSLKNGQSATIKGTVTGQTIGVIGLNDCSVVQ